MEGKLCCNIGFEVHGFHIDIAFPVHSPVLFEREYGLGSA